MGISKGIVMSHASDSHLDETWNSTLRRVHFFRMNDCAVSYSSSKILDYLAALFRLVSSRTEFVVARLSIVDLLEGPQAVGGLVICSTKTRKLGAPTCKVDQYPDGDSNGLYWTMIWLNRIFTPHLRLFFGWGMILFRSLNLLCSHRHADCSFV
jgi:hypothetical protein